MFTWRVCSGNCLPSFIRRKAKKVYIPFTEEQREQVRQTDLVAFLRQCGEIVKPSGFEFQWNNDGQKITIRGNVWYNQYEQFGGDVISFTQYFYDYSYQDVVCLMPKSSPSP